MLTSTTTETRRPQIGASGATGRNTSVRRVHGSLFLPATLLLCAAALADYVRSSVSLGGYFLESQDAKLGKMIGQVGMAAGSVIALSW